MKKLTLFIALSLFLATNNTALANRSESKYFTANCPVLKRIIPIGNTLTTTINPYSGALNSNLVPRFNIVTNSRDQLNLTMSAITYTQSGTVNAIFEGTNGKCIILANSSKLPAASSILDIKSPSPCVEKNSNAIAYRIEEPQSVNNVLAVSYNHARNDWDLKLNKRGITQTFITIPAGAPLNNTFGFNDEAGTYQATVILSFN